MEETQVRREKAILITVKLESEKEGWDIKHSAKELEDLSRSSGVLILKNVNCRIAKPTPDYFIGEGKAEEIALEANREKADTIIFSHDLSGTQQRNLEDIIGKKTIDRTQLILDIFARHAKTPEGKTQVELAQLQYLMPRLIGAGVILSRQGGGIGTSGPGEKQLEVDRRRIRKRVDRLKDDLERLRTHRQVMRKKRSGKVPVVALVGYTNAGKSTLLNTLTNAGQLVENSLFTTLDPLSKNVRLDNGENIVISDTVGFLNNLPHHLIEAFKATLEEVQEADLLIHVLDASHSRAPEYHQAVMKVLTELNVDKKPTVTALNKVDMSDDKTWLEMMEKKFKNSVLVSAKSGYNIQGLLLKVEEQLQSTTVLLKLVIPSARMDLVNLLYRQGRVINVNYTNEGIKVETRLPAIIAAKLLMNKDIVKLN